MDTQTETKTEKSTIDLCFEKINQKIDNEFYVIKFFNKNEIHICSKAKGRFYDSYYFTHIAEYLGLKHFFYSAGCDVILKIYFQGNGYAHKFDNVKKNRKFVGVNTVEQLNLFNEI